MSEQINKENRFCNYTAYDIYTSTSQITDTHNTIIKQWVINRLEYIVCTIRKTLSPTYTIMILAQALSQITNTHNIMNLTEGNGVENEKNFLCYQAT